MWRLTWQKFWAGSKNVKKYSKEWCNEEEAWMKMKAPHTICIHYAKTINHGLYPGVSLQSWYCQTYWYILWVLVVTKKGTEGFLLVGSHQSIESAILEVYPTNSKLSNHALLWPWPIILSHSPKELFWPWLRILQGFIWWAGLCLWPLQGPIW